MIFAWIIGSIILFLILIIVYCILDILDAIQYLHGEYKESIIKQDKRLLIQSTAVLIIIILLFIH